MTLEENIYFFHNKDLKTSPVVIKLTQLISTQLGRKYKVAGSFENSDVIKIKDSPTKVFFSSEEDGHRVACYFSDYSDSNLVDRWVENLTEAYKVLPLSLHPTLPIILLSGKCDSYSFVVIPYYFSISSRRLNAFSKYFIHNGVCTWLEEVTSSTSKLIPPDEINSKVREPLRAFSEESLWPTTLRKKAEIALSRSLTGQWQPRSVFSHNDFWQGNILFKSPLSFLKYRATERFVILDWAGATSSGWPFYDLIRYANSSWCVEKYFIESARLFLETLQCQPEDIESYLLLSLADIGLNRGQFPIDRFISLSENILNFNTKMEKSYK